MASHPRRRRLEVEDIKDVATVNFVDTKIRDEQNIQMIGDDLFRLVDELGRKKVLLNLSNVEVITDAALSKFISLHQKLQAVKGKLIIVGPVSKVMDLFRITKLDKIFTIVSTDTEAYSLFAAMPNAPTSTPASQTRSVPTERLEGVLTLDDIRQIEADGLTLGDAIRLIESSTE